MWQRLSRGYALQFEAIPLFLIFVCIYLAASNYAMLPDRVPTHFDIRNVADQWGGKGEIWIAPAFTAGSYLLFIGVSVGMAAVKNPISLINLPSRRKEALSLTEAESLRTSVIRFLFIMKACIMALGVYITWNTIEIAFERTPLPAWPLFALTGGILVAAGLMTTKAFRAGMGGGQGPAQRRQR